ncbi:uncharacterized protein F54H12.2 [Trichonephila clavipes]|nr:uncharacterized protein F54H12.2 [Trichonephila clavipes]
MSVPSVCCTKRFEDHYACQIGSGLTHYKGINFQKGYGIGGIFRRLFRVALPFLVKGGKTIGKEVLMTGSRVASEENFKEAVKTRSNESGKKLAQKAIDRVKFMVGKGQYKRKRKKQKKFISSKARTQRVIQDGQWKQFHPLSNVFDNAPVEFHISGSAEDYIDLSQTQLYVKAKIVKVDNTPITKDDTIGPVNLFLHSLFSQVDVFLNDRVVSNSSNTYPYRSYIETLLNHGYVSKIFQLTAELFYKDSDDGRKKRTEFVKESATVARREGSKDVDQAGHASAHHTTTSTNDRYIQLTAQKHRTDESRFSSEVTPSRVLLGAEGQIVPGNNLPHSFVKAHNTEELLMVWGGISIGGRTDLHIIPELTP